MDESTRYTLFFYLGIFIFIINVIIYGFGIDFSYFGIMLIIIGWNKIQLYSWILWLLWIFIIIDLFSIFNKIKIIFTESTLYSSIFGSNIQTEIEQLDTLGNTIENEIDETEENEIDETEEKESFETISTMNKHKLLNLDNPFNAPINFNFTVYQPYTKLHEYFSPNFESVTTQVPSKTKKIAFCFLIYDIINNEDYWKYFFDHADKNLYNIYIHYKENKPLKYFEDKKLKKSIKTHWGHKSLVKASNYLFKTAFEDDPENYKFILLSNSCIPLKPFHHIYKKLTADNMGYVNEARSVNFQYTITEMYKLIKDSFSKSSQWLIMNREMLEKVALVPDSDIDNYCTDIYAPDEIYYLSMLKHHGLYNQFVISENENSKATTFTYWNGMPNYPFSHSKETKASPYNFESIDSIELDYLLKEPCLFGRKFAPGCIVTITSTNTQTTILDYVKNKI